MCITKVRSVDLELNYLTRTKYILHYDKARNDLRMLLFCWLLYILPLAASPVHCPQGPPARGVIFLHIHPQNPSLPSPRLQDRDHAARLARFALDALSAAQAIRVDPADPASPALQLRAGVHCGPVSASLLGSHGLKYTLIGDTVNTASRMESTSAPGRVQCSAAAAALIARQDPAGLKVESRRGGVQVKGKGHMATAWVGPTPDAEPEGPPGPLSPAPPAPCATADRGVHSDSAADIQSRKGGGTAGTMGRKGIRVKLGLGPIAARGAASASRLCDVSEVN